MLTCDVCGNKYETVIGLNTHICKFPDEEHYKFYISILQSKVSNPNIKVLAYKRENDTRYVKIHNYSCGHTVWIYYHSLINQHQECNHKDCVSKKKSEAMIKVLETTDYRDKMSVAVKTALKDPVKRMNRLNGSAIYQRDAGSYYETIFINLLEDYEINYIHQVPLIVNDVGCIIDFYLPNFDLYVNINCDIFHKGYISERYPTISEKILATKEKDINIRDAFKYNNMTLIELFNENDLLPFIKSLKGGDANGKS